MGHQQSRPEMCRPCRIQLAAASVCTVVPSHLSASKVSTASSQVGRRNQARYEKQNDRRIRSANLVSMSLISHQRQGVHEPRDGSSNIVQNATR